MKKLITIFIFTVLFAFVQNAKAQSYASAAGVRFGKWMFGGTYKKMIKDGIYLDLHAGFLSSVSDILVFGGNLEIHKELEGVDGLYYFYGGGARAFTGSGIFSIEVTGVLGLDYKFEEIPVNVSIDWMPGYYFSDYSGFTAEGGGVSIRYVLSEN